jgi:hypothetical protein
VKALGCRGGAATAAWLWLLVGCGARPPREPAHAAVVCVEQACTAEGLERASAFERWARPALHRKGSTFSIWEVTGGEPHRSFAACIPEQWGAQVTRAMAAFLREGRDRAAQGGEVLPAGCGREQPIVAELLLLDGKQRRLLRPSPAPLQLAVVCDRSDSTLGVACDAARLLPIFDDWIARSGGSAGSSFTLVGVGHTRDSAEILLRAVASEPSAPERVARLVVARSRIARALENAPDGSAIAEATSVAAEELSHARGDRELLVLSDLRQVTRGFWNFEVEVPAPASFVRWLTDRQLLVRLDASVKVCGFHHRRAPGARPFDARLSNAVKAAWAAAFGAMKVRKVELSGDCAEGLSAERPPTIAAR